MNQADRTRTVCQTSPMTHTIRAASCQSSNMLSLADNNGRLCLVKAHLAAVHLVSDYLFLDFMY